MRQNGLYHDHEGTYLVVIRNGSDTALHRWIQNSAGVVQELFSEALRFFVGATATWENDVCFCLVAGVPDNILGPARQTSPGLSYTQPPPPFKANSKRRPPIHAKRRLRNGVEKTQLSSWSRTLFLLGFHFFCWPCMAQVCHEPTDVVRDTTALNIQGIAQSFTKLLLAGE